MSAAILAMFLGFCGHDLACFHRLKECWSHGEEVTMAPIRGICQGTDEKTCWSQPYYPNEATIWSSQVAEECVETPKIVAARYHKYLKEKRKRDAETCIPNIGIPYSLKPHQEDSIVYFIRDLPVFIDGSKLVQVAFTRRKLRTVRRGRPRL